MSNSPFDKVKSNFKQAGKQMSLAARIAKLKVEVATQKGEKERHLKTIGVKVFAMYSRDKTLTNKSVQDEITNELNLIKRIDKHIEELDDEIAQLQAEFRNAEGKDIVDATDVKSIDDSSRKTEDS